MTADEVLERLVALSDPGGLEQLARFGSRPAKALGGISAPALQKLAREVGKDHVLAQELWESGVHEARLLACMIDEPKAVSEEQMERWVADFDAWDLCDTCCGYLFDKTPIAYRKAMEWSARSEEYVKRSSFALMAYLAVHDKQAPDDKFLEFLPVIERESDDDRNFVKKAVNWALRQIGKRNLSLNAAAIATAREIQARGTKAARWVAADALRELTGDAVQERLRSKATL
jgi:3-methyladenine DNA glycosylase AlkD